MAWSGIKPDTFQRVPGGINIWSYLLKDNGYGVPPMRAGAPQGISLVFVPIYQFLYEKQRPSDITSRQIEHLDPNGLIPNYFITFDSIWQVLEDTRCWQKSDGSANDKTIALAISTADCLIPPMYKQVPINMAAKLTAYLLKKHKLTINDVKIAKDHPEVFQWKEFKRAVLKGS